jgi:hypothetical protein
MKYLLTLLLSLSLLVSCNKDSVMSDATRVTQEIQRVTNSNPDITVRVYNTAQALQGETTGLVIDGDFVVVNQVHYNLGRLASYRYLASTTTGGKPALLLYF